MRNILFILFVILSLACFSFISKSLGDYFLSLESSRATFFYQLGSHLNPLDKSFAQRLQMVQTLLTERQIESEETGEKPTNIASNFESQVLGVSVRVPVLMYHYIRVNPDPNDRVGFNLSVTPANFAAQMDYLSSHNYHPISLDEMGAALFLNKTLPEKPIVITLDDGYVDSFTNAYPILKQHNFKAVNFIITGFVGGPRYLSWSQIDEMKNSGVFTFGSHTLTHHSLTSLGLDSVSKELIESKQTLTAHLGYPINWFAYPYGFVNQQVANKAKEAGYLGAFGTNRGTFQSTDNIFTLPRIRIGGSDSVSSFAQKLPWN